MFQSSPGNLLPIEAPGTAIPCAPPFICLNIFSLLHFERGDKTFLSSEIIGSKAQNEIVSQQIATSEKTSSDLRKTITELEKENEDLRERIAKLQEDNIDQAQQIVTLKKEKEVLYDIIAEKDSQIDALKQLSPSDSENHNSGGEMEDGNTVKLTSLKILGNSQSSLNYIYNSLENSDDAKSNLGDAFNSSISMRRNGNIDFYLGASYRALYSTICISEGTKNIDDYSSTLSIYKVEGNGSNEELETLYTSPELTMGFIPTEIGPIDISGVEHLRISFYADGYYGNVPRIILGNPVLIPQ